MNNIIDITSDFKKILEMKNRIDVDLKNKDDIEIAYEGIFLYSVTKFENFIEEIFLGFLIGKLKFKNNSILKKNNSIKFNSLLKKEEIISFLLGEKDISYIDWLPYTKTEKRAKRFFNDGYPFSFCNDKNLLNSYDFLLDTNDKEILNKIIKIRNYIAHKSDDSLDKLKKEISTYKNINELFNSIHSSKITFFEYFLRSLNKICLKLLNSINI